MQLATIIILLFFFHSPSQIHMDDSDEEENKEDLEKARLMHLPHLTDAPWLYPYIPKIYKLLLKKNRDCVTVPDQYPKDHDCRKSVYPSRNIDWWHRCYFLRADFIRCRYMHLIFENKCILRCVMNFDKIKRRDDTYLCNPIFFELWFPYDSRGINLTSDGVNVTLQRPIKGGSYFNVEGADDDLQVEYIPLSNPNFRIPHHQFSFRKDYCLTEVYIYVSLNPHVNEKITHFISEGHFIGLIDNENEVGTVVFVGGFTDWRHSIFNQPYVPIRLRSRNYDPAFTYSDALWTSRFSGRLSRLDMIDLLPNIETWRYLGQKLIENFHWSLAKPMAAHEINLKDLPKEQADKDFFSQSDRICTIKLVLSQTIKLTARSFTWPFPYCIYVSHKHEKEHPYWIKLQPEDYTPSMTTIHFIYRHRYIHPGDPRPKLRFIYGHVKSLKNASDQIENNNNIKLPYGSIYLCKGIIQWKPFDDRYEKPLDPWNRLTFNLNFHNLSLAFDLYEHLLKPTNRSSNYNMIIRFDFNDYISHMGRKTFINLLDKYESGDLHVDFKRIEHLSKFISPSRWIEFTHKKVFHTIKLSSTFDCLENPLCDTLRNNETLVDIMVKFFGPIFCRLCPIKNILDYKNCSYYPLEELLHLEDESGRNLMSSLICRDSYIYEQRPQEGLAHLPPPEIIYTEKQLEDYDSSFDLPSNEQEKFSWSIIYSKVPKRLLVMPLIAILFLIILFCYFTCMMMRRHRIVVVLPSSETSKNRPPASDSGKLTERILSGAQNPFKRLPSQMNEPPQVKTPQSGLSFRFTGLATTPSHMRQLADRANKNKIKYSKV